MAGNPVDTSYNDAIAITASDSTVYAPPLRAVWVGSTGSLVIVTPAGTTVEIDSVPSGGLVPLNAAQIMAASTATSIVGLK